VNDVQTNSIPGVRCGKCLGRIDDGAIEMKRKLHDRLRPTEPFVMPRLCSECWFGAVLSLCAEDDDDVGDETKSKDR
jgi:hypothetical protein